MSLPNSEPLPKNISELPPARQRHIRRQPRSASLAERQLLLESVLMLTAPNLAFFTQSLLGSIAAGAALYFDDPAVLILAIVLLPFLKPAFGLALLPASPKGRALFKHLISLMILLSLIFAGGILSGWLKVRFSIENITIYRFSAPYWLDLVIVGTTAIVGGFIMVRKGSLPRLTGVILAYEILFPFAIAGYSLPLNHPSLLSGALLVGLTHLGLATLMGALTFVTVGFTPKRLTGWLFFLLPALLIAGGLLINLPTNPGLVKSTTEPTPVFTRIPVHSLTPPPQATASRTDPPQTPTLTPTATATKTPSPSATQTASPTQTHTPEPTTYWANVDSLTGAVIRESPAFDAPVTGYLNNGDAIEILDALTAEAGSLWYRISSPDGQAGWLLASLVNTQTPTP